MSHIFISYSHKDKAYVHRLQEALQDEGFDAWIDDRIDYGDHWLKVIQKHLDECDAFIIVMDWRGLAVHQGFGTDDVAAKGLSHGLVAQTDT